MLMMAGKGAKDECVKLSEEAISSGKALEVFRRSVSQQGGATGFIDNYGVLGGAKKEYAVYSTSEGYISKMNSEDIGLASLELGAGRRTKESEIDYTAGIVLEKEYGDYVKKGDKLAVLYTSTADSFVLAEKKVLDAVVITEEKPPARKCVIKVIE